LRRRCAWFLSSFHSFTLITSAGAYIFVLLVLTPCACADPQHEDLSRIYRLFGKKDEWLVPIANIVREHISSQGHECVDRREARLQAAAAGVAAPAAAEGGAAAAAEGGPAAKSGVSRNRYKKCKGIQMKCTMLLCMYVVGFMIESRDCLSALSL